MPLPRPRHPKTQAPLILAPRRDHWRHQCPCTSRWTVYVRVRLNPTIAGAEKQHVVGHRHMDMQCNPANTLSHTHVLRRQCLLQPRCPVRRTVGGRMAGVAIGAAWNAGSSPWSGQTRCTRPAPGPRRRRGAARPRPLQRRQPRQSGPSRAERPPGQRLRRPDRTACDPRSTAPAARPSVFRKTI